MQGRKIKKLRESLGWTGEQLSTYLGVSLGAVYQWEKNRSQPRIGVLTRLFVLYQASKRNVRAGQVLGQVLEEKGTNQARARALAMVDRHFASRESAVKIPVKRKAPAKKQRS